MKNLKIKISALALFLALFTLNASAQQQRRGGQGGERLSAEKVAEISTDKLDQTLELSDSQEKKIYAINLKYAEQSAAQRSEAREAKSSEEKKAERPDREAMKSKMEEAKATQKAKMVEIMNILTDEQKIDYAFMLSKSGAKRGGQGQHGAQQGRQGQQKRQGQGGKAQQGQQRKGGKAQQGQSSKGESGKGQPQKRGQQGSEAQTE